MKIEAICLIAHAPMRAEPSDKSEMINELIYGEPVMIIENHGSWLYIESQLDSYSGWVDRLQVSEQPEEIQKNRVVLRNRNIFLSDRSILLSYGSLIPAMESSSIESSEDPVSPGKILTRLINDAKLWLNASYVWGGKSIFGVDCSGFIQTIFRGQNLLLPRDSYQQAEKGHLVAFEDAKAGDLAFFSKTGARIDHVGLLIESNRIIHASSYVRIDGFVDEGILSLVNGRLSHKLHSIRRIL